MTTIELDLRDIILTRVKTAPLRELLALTEPEQRAMPLAQPRFEIVDDQIVIDHRTGLTWLRGVVPGGRRSYDESMAAAAALDIHGWKWRAPTIQERLSINDYERYNPAIDTTVFRSESSGWEWTSTLDAESPADYAWLVDFDDGYSGRGDRYYDGFVRAVRVGQF